MGRKLRVFSNKEVLNSSELSKKKASTEIMKYAHSKFHNKKDINFKVNYNTLEFTNFKDYSTFMDLVKIFQTYNLEYNNCCNGLQDSPCNNINGFCLQHNSQIPLNIVDGLKSHVYSDELIMYAKNCSCSEYGAFERTTDTTVYDNSNMYDHGHVFKVKMGQNFKFPAKLKLGECSTINEPPEIKTCYTSFGGCQNADYEVIYPSQYNFLKYTANDDHTNCSKNVDPACIGASEKQMKSFSVFPRHKKEYKNMLPEYIKKCKNKPHEPIKTCGINNKMHSLLLRKEKELRKYGNCNFKK